MRYSLLSRFQGALLGAALGENLAVSWQQFRSTKPTTGFLNQWQPGARYRNHHGSSTPVISWQGRTAIGWLKALTSRNGTSDLQSNPFISPSADRSEPSEIGVNTEELAIAALPLSLFFHDSEIKLQQALESLLSPSQQEAQPAILAVSFAIARLLQEQTEPLTLVLQTVNFLKRIIPQTAISQGLIHQLEQVQQCLVGQVSLQTAITKILPLLGPGSVETGAIALAFYCILSTPEHFSLALLRAVQVSDRPVTIAALTGALAGAHNSVHGIPLEWQIILNDSTELAVWGMSGVQLEELATRLLINWSGVYDAANVGAIPPIAAPGVIRPR